LPGRSPVAATILLCRLGRDADNEDPSGIADRLVRRLWLECIPMRRASALAGAAIVAGRWSLTTLVRHVRGPAEWLAFGGSPINVAIPVGVAKGGNIALCFQMLSWAGALAVTVMIDPEPFPDLGVLIDGLRAELDQISQG